MSEMIKQPTREAEVAREQEPQERRRSALRPAVDIYERDHALHLLADLPGVTAESLSIEVNDNVLTLEGEIRLAMPEGATALYAELRGQRFLRRFTLSHEIDGEAIEARLRDGVLHLRLPKKESHRPRRIGVQAA
ncbi:Hsp20/alpha crystallin family protein [Halomonas sp. 328]|uniref:Hsp20/alpha crystallin family protein n=1 Tax=Halomonas sp. 328 TaxID=2776704 RepID=UPI0018A74A8D|nr:Hsp20/alpha crystallin family protein [Halomonas sp. 328]MBF8223979.1 Hsp20/alpha crystallin family protein [Halomonas sp. 328]